MADNFEGYTAGIDAPASRHTPITPSDTVSISPRPRGLYCTGAGDAAVVDQDGTVVIYALLVGDLLPFRAVRVNATDTTATVVGWD